MRAALAVLIALAACSFGGHGGIDGGGDDARRDASGDASGDARADAPTDGACPTEVCNGMDDDCDGMTDEGFVLGAACDGIDGDACAEGVVVCTADGLATECGDVTGTIVEVCVGGGDEDCNGRTDCADAPCCADAACAPGAYCCTGTGLVHTIGNTCVNDFGSSGSSDNLEVYCCDGIARFCLSGETCPWRGGCVATDATCSRGGLATDAMGTATCQLWRGQTTYNCAPDEHAYFP